ncbi:MAG: 3-deoxy-manno-octulosonate cytidylyltransferase [Bacteroidetes bacterium]|nr:3-deoxy-manno-octulosonate cytidylyltransferase [Bacteroidota bacterium]MCL2302614.1 3-deoxy-manno-octulosonate cytidylyltransferase [Lentimicrobiaceae bacterium]
MKIGIIPARYASTRFPGKPLALIHNKPMIQHVYEKCKEADLDDLFVATDDERIRKAVENFGGKVIMTHSNHASGTDRCAEAAKTLNLNNTDVIINIQGDEPFIRKEEINLLSNLFDNQNIQIATLAKPIANEEELNNPNKVKVVFTNTNKALYFSRSTIPYITSYGLQVTGYKHIGIYAYRNDVLQQITQLPVSTLEEIEKLEQLRWLENDFAIHVQICYHESVAIDTPEDLENIIEEKGEGRKEKGALPSPFFLSPLNP